MTTLFQALLSREAVAIAEVRAVWDGVELTAPVTTCPAMVVLEWPEELSTHKDTSPDIRFYDAVGTEIPRE